MQDTVLEDYGKYEDYVYEYEDGMDEAAYQRHMEIIRKGYNNESDIS